MKTETGAAMSGGGEREPWRAGGYAIWLTSDQLADYLSPLAGYITDRFGSAFPVRDGHITLVGNLAKSVDDPRQQQAIRDHSSRIVQSIRSDLQSSPLQLHFVDVYADAARPSQTLCVVAQESPQWRDLYTQVLSELGLPLPQSLPAVHSSIVYNHSPGYPVSQAVVESDLVPYVRTHLSLPFDVAVTGAELVATVGVPAQWSAVPV